MAQLVTLEDIRTARERTAGVAVRTGLYEVDPARVMAAGVEKLPFALFIKAESEQPIGSFKLRGAYNRIAQLGPEELRRGVITYSSGNHAQGVAYAARALGAKAVIVMPENAPEVKKQATAALGAEIVFVGPASSERLAKAQDLSVQHGYTIIPPYDDPAIIAGQGTCGLEIAEQIGLVDRRGAVIADGASTVILSPVSGGGLLSGIATAIKLAAPGAAQVWAVEPELAADATESFRTKALVEWPAAKTTRTLADGLRTQSLGVLNFAHVLRYVDGMVNVTEDEILQAMRIMLSATDLVPEPSGAVTFAAALFHHAELPACERMVVVLSGGNIDPALRASLTDASAPAPAGV
ncbi:MAG TPA: threonine/serine dehydratase [Acidobacteriaceae bacterium]|nr:threonine/serine dehydratase [Acidobacteriaceae bacterium]